MRPQQGIMFAEHNENYSITIILWSQDIFCSYARNNTVLRPASGLAVQLAQCIFTASAAAKQKKLQKRASFSSAQHAAALAHIAVTFRGLF